MSDTPFLKKFKHVYSILNRDNLGLLETIYDERIVFKDPLHTIEGLTALKHYFKHMYQGISYIHFDYKEELVIPNKATIFWTMQYNHKKINRGNTVSVEGATMICFTDKATYHRDYFDLGEMLYERLPLIGPVVSFVKKRAAQL